MDDREHAATREHILAIATRTTQDDDELRERLLRAAWPGGPADRTQPAALEWVRRWRATRGTPLEPSCTCTAGRCTGCN